jgi:hypothetical protein
VFFSYCLLFLIHVYGLCIATEITLATLSALRNRPIVVIADYLCHGCINGAEALSIPVIINLPLLLGGLGIPFDRYVPWRLPLWGPSLYDQHKLWLDVMIQPFFRVLSWYADWRLTQGANDIRKRYGLPLITSIADLITDRLVLVGTCMSSSISFIFAFLIRVLNQCHVSNSDWI